jgi:hypothetical protein
MACDCTACDACEERAERRARRFLYRHLTRDQKRSIKDNEYLIVKGNVTNKEYRVYFDGGDSVFTVGTDGDCDYHYCLAVMDEDGGNVPEGDRVLARKLLIQSDEKTFLATACRTEQ